MFDRNIIVSLQDRPHIGLSELTAGKKTFKGEQKPAAEGWELP